MTSSREKALIRLRFRSRCGFERLFSIPQEGIVIGSRADAGIRVGIPGVPREACVLHVVDGRLFFAQTEPKFVKMNESPAQPGAPIAAGARLRIGPATFTIEIDS